MADQWKARVVTIAGKPVALVDIHIIRTIFVDAEAFEGIAPLLVGDGNDEYKKSGLSGVAAFYSDIQNVPESMRPFIVVPWTPADSEEIGLRSFAEIVKRLENESYWRVEGDANVGFRGILNFGGQNQVIKISEADAPSIDIELTRIRSAAATDFADGKLNQKDKEKIDRVCDIVGKDTLECVRFEKLQRQVRAENDRNKREQEERELRDNVRDHTSTGSHEGGARQIGERFSGFGRPDAF